jgi:hypothetical protein
MPELIVLALLLLTIVACTAPVAAAAPSAVGLQFGPGDGQFSLSLDGANWLRSAPIIVCVGGTNFSTADGSLKPAGNRSITGCDELGDFTSTVLAWKAGPADFETEFRRYGAGGVSVGGAVVFEQRFPVGADGTANVGAHAEATVMSSFPAFQLDHGAAAGPAAYVSFAGLASTELCTGCKMGLWPPDGKRTARRCQAGGHLDTTGQVDTINQLASGWESAGALALFDGQANATLVLSPASAFTTTQSVQRAGVLSFGPRGAIENVPAGFSASVIAVAGEGIGRTMRQWGLALQRKGGKNPNLWQNDYSMQYLGYTTDNGAYYYYHTEAGQNYEQTILALKRATVAAAIPIRWILYDSWFYAKANSSSTPSAGPSPSHAALNWSDALPTVFPSGLRELYKATGGRGRQLTFHPKHTHSYATFPHSPLTTSPPHHCRTCAYCIGMCAARCIHECRLARCRACTSLGFGSARKCLR